MSLSRRTFIRGAAGAAAVTAPVVAEAASPRDRLDLAIAELQAAANEIWPAIDDWRIAIGKGRDVPIVITAFTPIGRSAAKPMYPAKPGVAI